MNSYRLCAVKLGFKDIYFRSSVMNVLWYLGYCILVRNDTNSLLATNTCRLQKCVHSWGKTSQGWV